MDRRDLIKYLAFNPMAFMLLPKPRGPQPVPPNEYRRGRWAQVFYTKHLLGRGDTYIANYPVKRTKVSGNEWFDVEFEKGLIVTRINYFEASKYLGYTIVRMQNDITGLGINTRYLKQ